MSEEILGKLNLSDYTFKPHSDVSLSDKDIVERHDQLIKEGNFNEATRILDYVDFSKGIRASFFNTFEEKIKKIQIFVLNKLANPDEFYSITEPTSEQMKGKKFWIQPYE